MSSPRITYTPRADATPESEVAVLSNVFRYILDCHHAKKNAASVTSTNGGEPKGSRNDRPAEPSIS